LPDARPEPSPWALTPGGSRGGTEKERLQSVARRVRELFGEPLPTENRVAGTARQRLDAILNVRADEIGGQSALRRRGSEHVGIAVAVGVRSGEEESDLAVGS
jgi:hypothetical protein